jgi:hypothetical protein
MKKFIILSLTALFLAPFYCPAGQSSSGQDSMTFTSPKGDYSNFDSANTKGYFSLGAAIGAPSGLNLKCEYLVNNLTLALSAGIMGSDVFGVQAEIGYIITKTPLFHQGPAFIAGFFRSLKTDSSGGPQIGYNQEYIGVAYNIYYAGFFLQGGLGFGFGSYPPNPILIFQAGYEFRL